MEKSLTASLFFLLIKTVESLSPTGFRPSIGTAVLVLIATVRRRGTFVKSIIVAIWLWKSSGAGADRHTRPPNFYRDFPSFRKRAEEGLGPGTGVPLERNQISCQLTI